MNLGGIEVAARSFVAPGKGILAADESAPASEKRFKAIEVPPRRRTGRIFLVEPETLPPER